METAYKKPSITWNKDLNIKFIGDIWALAYYALKDAGKTTQLQQMQDQIKHNSEPKEIIKIIQQYVNIEGYRSKTVRRRA